MNKIFFLLAFSFTSFTSNSQSVTFIKNYLFGGLNLLGTPVIQTHDSGYATLCRTDSGLTLVKSNAFGDTLWTKTYTNFEGGLGYRLAEKKAGGYFILTSSYCGGAYECSSIISTDNMGESIWSQTYNLNYSTWFNGIILDANDNIFLAGSTNYGISSDIDEVIMRLDSSGNILFQKTFVKNSADCIWSFCIGVNNDFYLLSFSDSTLIGGAQYARVTRTDSSGNIIWTTQIDSSKNGYFDLVLSEDHSLLAIIPTNTYSSAIVKLDSSGNQKWMKHYFPSYYSVNARKITTAQSKNFAMTGGIIDSVNGWHRQIFFLLIDSDGNELASTLYPEAYEGYCINSTFDNGFIIAADDVNSASMEPGFYLIKTDGMGVVANVESHVDHELLQLFPNPTQNLLTITLPTTTIKTLEVKNELGSTVIQQQVSTNDAVFNLNVAGLPGGFYFLILHGVDKDFAGKFLVVRD